MIDSYAEDRAQVMELALKYFAEVEEGTLFSECLQEVHDYINEGLIEETE